jgi:hypothetical protein
MKWIITVMSFRSNGHTYKVTRKIPALSIHETKFFSTKQQAEEQVKAWIL